MIVIIGGKAGAKIASQIFSQKDKIGYIETYLDKAKDEQLFSKLDDGLEYLKKWNVKYFVATGDNLIRRMHIEKIIKATNKYPINCIHSSAVVSYPIGYGNLILANAVINVDAKIGNGTIINSNATVEHDCVIEDYAQISPGATVCGYSKVKQNTFVGANSTIIPEVTIGENTLIAAGSTVISDIPSNVMAAGSPAEIKKRYEI